MFDTAAKLPIFTHFRRKASEFRSDERGAIAIFVLMIFVMMLLVGGIAVDVMRAEMRRVTYQQTFDRAVLAAANISLPPGQSPVSVGQSWYNVAGLGDEFTVDYGTPTFTGVATASSREARATGTVRSYNHFMHMLDIPYFNMPVRSAAQQGVSKIEVILALDITGSMAESSGNTTKIAALRTAAANFVDIMKFSRDAQGNYTIPKDPNNLISIGMVPYASNVNIPVDLRNQFTVSHLSSWDGVANQGVPNHNCFEINPATYNQTALSRTTPIPMAAVAITAASAPSVGTITLPGANNTNGANGGVVNLGPTNPTAPTPINYSSSGLMCNNGDNPKTPANEALSNLVVLPTTNTAPLKAQISALNPKGNTSIAVGMRWATALIDESARPIYSALRGNEPAMAGRPANNNDNDTRKIIVLMTDGNHVASRHIKDDYKTGASPIWRGTDGNMAIEFNDSGVGINGGTRPGIAPTATPANSCSGWSLANTVVNGKVVKRNFFVPHLKAASVRRRVNASETEGNGTGTLVTGGCDPRAWIAPTNGVPVWPGSGVVRRLDWSEVWRYATVDWVIEQLYMRSNVSSATSYTTVYNTFVANYLVNAANMDNLLNINCTAAKNAGIEVFGIVFGDDVSLGPIQNCSSPGTGYFYHVLNPADLNAAFEQIAVLISELRLTQ
ncbi:TadE/TadG family type IV pilus assembly protein [Rhodobacter calidifons]|uniref:Putative Flp pilus-assembly TadG-like N-terminal domain-containing protein n=1 Tax=Rhodobacter calidifons TaxID=2715277 RepID=A0ABX0G6T2_9RHOB|nr:Tad domain-containing protein [Rhodobacter calidifons]NHB76929.1 hypothetical protein [Rhodobacter calidifons]